MYISSDILLRGLEGHGLSVDVKGDVNGALALARVLFAEEESRLSDGFVYIAESGRFVKAAKTEASKFKSVCVISGGHEAGLFDCFEAVFVVGEGIAAATLHNIVQRVYERYELWQEELWAVLNAGSDVQAMIDIGTQVIGNPLVLQDSNFSVIALSSEYAGDPSLEPILDSKNAPYMMMADRSRHDKDSERSSVVPLKIMGRRALYRNMLQQGRFHYRMLVIELDGEFHPSVPTLLELLTGYIQIAIGFVVEEPKEPALLPLVIEGILTGEFKDPGVIEQRLLEFQWEKGHEYVCAKIFAQLPDYNNRTMRFICDRLSVIFTEACIFEYENSLAAFFNLSLSSYDIDNVKASLMGFLQDNNMKAGMSCVFSGFGNICEYYIQADEALRLGPVLKPFHCLHFFPEVRELFILDSCTEKLPAYMICDQGILKLRDYDEKNQQELYRTLYVYLKNNCRSVSAAKELYIHRSTFLYRLDRIRKIMGSALDDEQNHWYLLLSYKLLERDEQ